MKIAIATIVKSQPALVALSGTRMPAATAFKVRTVLSTLQPILKNFSAERDELLKSVGEADGPVKPDGSQSYKLNDPERYTREMDEMGKVEVDITVPQIGIGEFGNAEMSPGILVDLDWLVFEK